MESHLDLNWDNIRHFLAVMRSKSIREASKRLGVTHPTTRRRIQALEQQLDLTLFISNQDGLQATPEALEILKLAEQMEESMQAMNRCANNINPRLQGQIRVTAPDIVMSQILMPDIALFLKRWPQIELHIEATYEMADLKKQEADVAIRAMPVGKVPHGDLVGRKAATVYTAVYGQEQQWIGWSDGEQEQKWNFKSPFPDLPVIGSMSNIHLQLAACRAGIGLSILPCFMADPYMKRLTKPKPSTDIWVLVHPDLRKNPRLRLFRDEMVDALSRQRNWLKGSTDQRVQR